MEQAPTNRITDWRQTFLAAGLLGVLALALFSPAVRYGFLNYDDDVYVYQNAHVSMGLSGSGIRYALTTCDVGTWAPLTWLSYECDTSALGPRASSYHATNILLHAAAGALLFVALRLMRQSLWVSVAVAALFLVHPLRVESVVWISERKDVLCAFFWMLGLVAYSRYAQKPNWRSWAWVFVCLVAGLMSKMMMVTFPFVLLLLDYWPLGRFDFTEAAERRKLWPLVMEKVPFLVAVIVALLISSVALHSRGAFAARPSEGAYGLARVPENYLFYPEKIFWPFQLSVLYPLGQTRPGIALLSGALLLLITLAALWQARKIPWLTVGWFWFLGTLVPVVGFVPFGDFAVADRYSYIPSIGILWLVAAGAEQLARPWALARWCATGALAAACAMATSLNLPKWQDSLSVFNAALRVGPHYVSYTHRGAAFLAAGDLQGAFEDFNSAIKVNPRYAAAYNNRGVILLDQGRSDEALRDFGKAIECDPYSSDAYNNRANAWARKGQPENALSDYNRSINLSPNNALYYNNRASAYFQLKRFAEAAADLETCRQMGGQPQAGLVQAVAEAMKSSANPVLPEGKASSR